MIEKAILIVCAFTVLYVCEVKADTYLDVNGASVHSLDYFTYGSTTHKFNGQNVGIGVTTDLNKYVDGKVGFYKNSYYHPSAYAAINIHTESWYGIEPGVTVGFASGYNNTPMHSGLLQLYVVPNVAVRYKDFGVVVGYIPPIPGEVVPVSVVTVQFQYQLN
jgi:ribosomal protein L27